LQKELLEQPQSVKCGSPLSVFIQLVGLTSQRRQLGRDPARLAVIEQPVESFGY
jgi:hypothetical protein